MSILDLRVVCSNCKGKIWDEAIYKTDSVLGIIGECCSHKWGDIQQVLMDNLNKEYKMRMSYDELLGKAEIFKEDVWHFLGINSAAIKEAEQIAIKEKVNAILDALDELPFEN